MRITGTLSTLLLSPLLLVQAWRVKHGTPRLPEAPGDGSGTAGRHGPLLRLRALGDSIIAGVGVGHTREALPARLASALARRLERRVDWASQGRSGARTRDLLDEALPADLHRADLVLLSNGLNDVTAPIGLRHWLEQQDALFARLREKAPGALLVQLGLPPLGDFPALPQPLRHVLGQRARRFDDALERRLRDRPGVLYLPFRERAKPALFADDGYHPGPAAIDLWAERLAMPIERALKARLGNPV